MNNNIKVDGQKILDEIRKNKEGKKVFTCLWHNLQFYVDNGKCLTHKTLCLRKYEVEVENKEIFVYIN